MTQKLYRKIIDKAREKAWCFETLDEIENNAFYAPSVRPFDMFPSIIEGDVSG